MSKILSSIVILTSLIPSLSFSRSIEVSKTQIDKFEKLNGSLSQLVLYSSRRLELISSDGRPSIKLKKSTRGRILEKESEYLYVTFNSSCQSKDCGLTFKLINNKYYLHQVPSNFTKVKIQQGIRYKEAKAWRTCRYCDDSKLFSVSPFFKKMSKTWVGLKSSSSNF